MKFRFFYLILISFFIIYLIKPNFLRRARSQALPIAGQEFTNQNFTGSKYFSDVNKNNIPSAIYHAFDQKLNTIDDRKLAVLKSLGITHVQISPIQESHVGKEWFYKYQPVSYKIGNDYGDKEDLKGLAERLHKHGLKLIVDIVFNHLRTIEIPNEPNMDEKVNKEMKELTNADWKKAWQEKGKEFEFFNNQVRSTFDKLFMDNSPNCDMNFYSEWNEQGWLGGALPQLNTLNEKVKSAQLNYLRELMAAGVDGFRFDASMYISPKSIEDYAEFIGPNKWSYAEIVETLVERNKPYSDILPTTDFVLLNSLIQSFSWDGSLKDLWVPLTNQKKGGITFALNHDTWASMDSGGKHGINLTFKDNKDIDLATAFVLARKDGIPLILASDVQKRDIKIGLKFRKIMEERNAPYEFIADSEKICPGCSSKTLLVMSRGEEGLLFINKNDQEVSHLDLDLSDYTSLNGCYMNMREKSLHLISEREGRKLMINVNSESMVIPPRSSQFFIKVEEQMCKDFENI